MRALRSVDLEIRRGEYVSIVGQVREPGKSTLLNVLGLLDRPTHGAYELDGFDVGSLSDTKQAAVELDNELALYSRPSISFHIEQC